MPKQKLSKNPQVIIYGNINLHRPPGQLHTGINIRYGQIILLACIILLIFQHKLQPEKTFIGFRLATVSHIDIFVTDGITCLIHKTNSIGGFLDDVTDRFRLEKLHYNPEAGNSIHQA